MRNRFTGWRTSTPSGTESATHFRAGEPSYWSQLFVDEHNILQVTDPGVTIASLEPSCKCCTHTFIGEPFAGNFDPRPLSSAGPSAQQAPQVSRPSSTPPSRLPSPKSSTKPPLPVRTPTALIKVFISLLWVTPP